MNLAQLEASDTTDSQLGQWPWLYRVVPATLTDVLLVAIVVAIVGALVYVPAARSRTRSRLRHSEAPITGQGSWDGAIDESDLERFIPEANVGFVKSLFLSEGIPVRLEVDAQGLTLTIRSRLLKRYADRTWSAPWTEVVSAENRFVGFKTLGGKISPVRLTDVVVVVVGNSAQTFLDSWDLVPDPDDRPATTEDVASDAEWLQHVRNELGPSWRPGTALLRVRMSAADGIAEAISRWARGTPLAGD